MNGKGRTFSCRKFFFNSLGLRWGVCGLRLLTGTRFKRTLRVASVSCLLSLRLKCSCVVAAAAAVVVAAAGNPFEHTFHLPPSKHSFFSREVKGLGDSPYLFLPPSDYQQVWKRAESDQETRPKTD